MSHQESESIASLDDLRTVEFGPIDFSGGLENLDDKLRDLCISARLASKILSQPKAKLIETATALRSIVDDGETAATALIDMIAHWRELAEALVEIMTVAEMRYGSALLNTEGGSS